VCVCVCVCVCYYYYYYYYFRLWTPLGLCMHSTRVCLYVYDSRGQSHDVHDTAVSVTCLHDKVGELKLDNDRLSAEVSRLTSELDSVSSTVSVEAWASRRREDLLDREVSLLCLSLCLSLTLGPDLQNILRQSYNSLTIMPKLRSTYDGCLIYKTFYEGCKDFLRCNSLAKS